MERAKARATTRRIKQEKETTHVPRLRHNRQPASLAVDGEMTVAELRR